MIKIALLPKAAIFYSLLLLIFSANIIFAMLSYEKLKEFDYHTLHAKLISQKERVGANGGVYFSLFFRSSQIDFRGYFKSSLKSKEGEYFSVLVKTKELSFVDMFKTPRLKIVSLEPTGEKSEIQTSLKEFLSAQHKDVRMQEFYLNLFLNSEVGAQIEDFINSYGLGAFFAISGLNVALLIAFIFFILVPPFRYIQDRFFPYSNRNFWIYIFCLYFLFFYAYLADFTPSFMRAVVAAVVVFYFALRGDNILSYKTLFLTTIFCFAIFPAFVFSIGFWLSVYGVFLIFLFLANTDFKHKALIYITLSSWLFFAMAPIIHYIFAIFTKAHLLNTLFGAIFDVFYPVSLMLHLFGLGWIFDDLLLIAISSAGELKKEEFLTPLWFFLFYIALSFAAAFDKRIFFAFNACVTAYFMATAVFLLL